MNTENFLSLVRAQMRHLGMSQQDLARRSKLTPGAISHYFRGRSVPSLPAALAMLSAVGLQVEPEKKSKKIPEAVDG